MDFIQSDYVKSRFKKHTIGIPIGTKKHMSQYKTRHGKFQVPPDDVVYLYSSPKDQLSILGILSTGMGKTRLLKRILPYLINEYNWKALLFDCKGFELYHGKFKTNNYNGLLPWETDKIGEIGAIDMRCYMPSFVRAKAEKRNLLKSPDFSYLNDFDVFSYQMDDIADTLEAATLGISPTARMIFLDKIKPKILSGELQNADEVVQHLKSAKINYAVKDNLITVFSYLAREKFFDSTKQKANILRDWKQDMTPMFSLLEPSPEQASFYVGKLIDEAYKGELTMKNKFVVIDDASKVLGKKMNSKEHMSVQQIEDLLTLGRYRRFHVK